MQNPGAVVFLLLTTLTVSLSTFLSASEEFTPYDRKIISGFVVGALVLQLAVAYAAHRSFRSAVLTNVILAAFLVFNVVCMRLAFDAGFLVQPVYVQLLFLLVGAFVAFTLFRAIEPKQNGWMLGALFALGFAAIDLWPNVSDAFSDGEFPNAIRMDGEGTASSRVRMVGFERTPDVYIVSFDSLIPRRLVNENLALAKVAYLPVLEKNFDAFRNVFADAVYTKKSLNAVLAMDMQWFWNIGAHRTKLFQGKVPSPLFQIFEANGYETNTLYRSNYFGIDKGPYVDRYFTARSFSACEFVDEDRVLAFFGYCWFQGTKYWKRLVVSAFGEKERNEIDWMLSRFEDAGASENPQVFLAYVYSPGHTEKEYDHADEGERFDYVELYEKRSERTAKMIQRLVDFVKRRDDESVLIVFGDHGPKMSAQSKFDADPRFFVIDRYGVYGGVHARGVCAPELSALRQEEFVTPTMMMRRLILCLSGGDDPFSEAPELVLQKNQFLPKTLRYEDFLYE